MPTFLAIMSKSGENRLDRLEALAEDILNGLQEVRYRTDSNARAIEALSSEWQKDRQEWQKDRQEWQKDRNRLYDATSRVAAAQATFWEIQADYYRRLEEIDERQAQIIEILDRLTSKD